MAPAGVSVTVDASSIEVAIARLRPLVGVDPTPLMEAIAALGESQTRRRLTDEKTAPDGTPWPANRAGGSILTQTGQHLLQSLAFYATAEEAVWGAAWEFAHVHQEGAVITPKTAAVLRFRTPDGKWVSKKSVTIPKREFVGLSAENRTEIEDLVSDYFGRLLR